MLKSNGDPKIMKDIEKEIYYERKYALSNIYHKHFKKPYYYLMWRYYQKKNERRLQNGKRRTFKWTWIS